MNRGRPEYPTLMREDRYPDGRTCWVAEHPDLPGCAVYASTMDEAVVLLGKLRESMLSRLETSGVPLPAASPGGKAEVVFFAPAAQEDSAAAQVSPGGVLDLGNLCPA